ncbi:MAG: MXAN_2561 family MXYO-CTERM-anchored protein [Archangium sp.]
MKRLLLLSVLVSAAAFAQPVGVVSVRPTADLTKDTYTYGAGECGNTIGVTWTNSSTVFATCRMGTLRFWSTTASTCGTTAGTDDVQYASVPISQLSLNTGTFNVKIGELPGHVTTTDGDGGVIVNCPFSVPKTLTHQLCVAYDYQTLGGFGTCTAATTPGQGNGMKFVYDTLPPSAPTIVSHVAQDGAASVEFSVDSDTIEVSIEVEGPNDADFRTAATAVVANTNTVRATGLTNGVIYDVRLRGVDGAGNYSTPSDAVQVKPILTNGLLGYYAANNGELKGGCSTSAGLMPLLFAAWALRSRLRRNKGSSSR